jgi:G-patch domain
MLSVTPHHVQRIRPVIDLMRVSAAQEVTTLQLEQTRQHTRSRTHSGREKHPCITVTLASCLIKSALHSGQRRLSMCTIFGNDKKRCGDQRNDRERAEHSASAAAKTQRSCCRAITLCFGVPSDRSVIMTGVSLSFGTDAAKAPAPKRRFHEEREKDDKHSISQFHAGVEGEAKPKKARKVIPCKPNNLLAKPKEEPDAVGKLEDRFQAAAKQEEASGEYGLMGRAQHGASTSSTPMQSAPPPAGRKRQPQALESLADEPDPEGYEDMPVEDFGIALLRGMGMSEENKVEVVEYVARPARMGLGVDPTKIGALGLTASGCCLSIAAPYAAPHVTCWHLPPCLALPVPRPSHRL